MHVQGLNRPQANATSRQARDGVLRAAENCELIPCAGQPSDLAIQRCAPPLSLLRLCHCATRLCAQLLTPVWASARCPALIYRLAGLMHTTHGSLLRK